MKQSMLLICSALVLAMPVNTADQEGNVVPIPVLSVDRFDGKYEPTCLGNGFVGFRPGINPLAPAPVAVEFEEKVRSEQPASPGNPASSKAPSFSAFPMSAAAAFFGKRDIAKEIFHNSWKPYWREPFGMTSEYPQNEFGSLITNYGSLLQNTLLGYTGLRIVEGDWRVYPASLPAGWSKIECDRIWVKGKPMKLIAENGKLARLTPVETK